MIVLSGHMLRDATALIHLGLDGFLCKPFTVERVFDVIAEALTGSAKMKNASHVLSPGNSIYPLLLDVREKYSSIQSLVDSDALGDAMLRHKMKQLVIDAVGKISPSCDNVRYMEDLTTGMDLVKKLAYVHRKSSEMRPFQYLKLYCGDQEKMSNVSFACEFDQEADETDSLVALAVVELIDNAMSAMQGTGDITVTSSVLESIGRMRIVVEDSGPGILEGVDRARSIEATMRINRALERNLATEMRPLSRCA